MQARNCETFVSTTDALFVVICEAESSSDAVFAILDIQNLPKLEHLSGYDRIFFKF